MPDALNLVLQLWTSILNTIPSSPFMYLFALAILLVILNNFYSFFRY